MPEFPPTAEQQEAIDAFRTGRNLAIEAGAGTGKTTTLRFLAEEAAKSGRIGQYTAFNKAIVEASRRVFPADVVNCSTMHSLAFRAVGKQFKSRLDNQSRLAGNQIAILLGIDPLVVDGNGGFKKSLSRGYLGSYTMRALKAFAHTADPEPTMDHFPYIDGIDLPTAEGRRSYIGQDQVRRHLLPALKKAWADVQRIDGHLRFEHDFYLKIWQLSNPVILADFILFDEAQDADPVQLDIVMQQRHAQLVMVGDSQQQIYSWRGAVNAMGTIREGDANVTFLTQSFRFGPAIAEVANGILGRLGAELRIVGFDKVNSTVGPVDEPDAILCRTNAEAVRQVISQLEAGRRPYLMGGANEVVRFAKAAIELQAGQPTSHPELACFETWGEVQAYVEDDPLGQELALMVKLIDDFGPGEIVRLLDNLGSGPSAQAAADVVVSTAHKAKGCEWDRVLIAGDFPNPNEAQDRDLSAEDLRLAYVAATRAKFELDVEMAPQFLGSMKVDVEALALLAPLPALFTEDDEASALELTKRYLEANPGTVRP